VPFNPYAADEEAIENVVPEYSMPRGTFAAPSLESGDAYNDEFGWSPKLRTSASGDTAPSAQRLGTIPRFDDYPDPLKPPQDYYDRLGADENQRHSAEKVQATPWDEPMALSPSDRRWAPNPRSTPPPESRVTQRMSPASYSFTRLFDQFNRTYAGGPPVGSARTFNGTHFSMADHARLTDAIAESAGAMPVRTGRNTYRTEPEPWDTNIVDLPPAQPIADQLIRSYDIPGSGSKAWRLS
jgi:hypothetical protein